MPTTLPATSMVGATTSVAWTSAAGIIAVNAIIDYMHDV